MSISQNKFVDFRKLPPKYYEDVVKSINKQMNKTLKTILENFDIKRLTDEQKYILNYIEQHGGNEKLFLTNYYEKAQAMNGKNRNYLDFEPADVYEKLKEIQVLKLDKDYERIETVGISNLRHCCFVINCYNVLPGKTPISCLMSKLCSLNPKYILHHYIEYILEFQTRTRISNGDNSIIIPIYLIVIEEIYDQIIDLLNLNDNFGLQTNQITLYRQIGVPVFQGGDIDKLHTRNGKILKSYYGNGGLHQIFKNREFKDDVYFRKKKYIIFLEDNNYLQFKVVPHTLGKMIESKLNGIVMAVKRLPGESYSFLLEEKFKEKASQRKQYYYAHDSNYDLRGRIESILETNALVLKEEYKIKNETEKNHITASEEATLDQDIEKKNKELKKSIIFESTFLTNFCVIETESYKESIYRREDIYENCNLWEEKVDINYNLNSTELKDYFYNKFVYNNIDNKKYSIPSHRLERAKTSYEQLSKQRATGLSNMLKVDYNRNWHIKIYFHDFINKINPDHEFATIVYPRWLCYSPLLTDLKGALSRVNNKLYPCALSNVETDLYYCNYKILEQLGVKVPIIRDSYKIQGIPHIKTPIIYLCPKFACSISEIKDKISIENKKIMIEANSTIYLSGNIKIHELSLSGGLYLETGYTGSITIIKLWCRNLGPKIDILDTRFLQYEMIDYSERLKGYRIRNNQMYMLHNATQQIYLTNEKIEFVIK